MNLSRFFDALIKDLTGRESEIEWKSPKEKQTYRWILVVLTLPTIIIPIIKLKHIWEDRNEGKKKSSSPKPGDKVVDLAPARKPADRQVEKSE